MKKSRIWAKGKGFFKQFIPLDMKKMVSSESLIKGMAGSPAMCCTSILYCCAFVPCVTLEYCTTVYLCHVMHQYTVLLCTSAFLPGVAPIKYTPRLHCTIKLYCSALVQYVLCPMYCASILQYCEFVSCVHHYTLLLCICSMCCTSILY